MCRVNQLLARYYLYLATLVWLSGCRDSIVPAVKPPAASLIFQKFLPDDALRQLGYEVKSSSRDARISPEDIYAWRAFYGTIISADGINSCESICKGIRQCLNSALDDHPIEESKSYIKRERGAPVLETYRYLLVGRRGIVYVWLYPNDSETEINYAILLHETCYDRSL
jgi:hypothetical protein